MNASTSLALAGRRALITGGNTGIGRAVAVEFARNGADVAVAWLDNSAATASLKTEVEQSGRRFFDKQTDVSNETEVESLFAALSDNDFSVDILVNNAGIQKSQPITETSCADFDHMLGVHLRGTFLVSRQAVDNMKRAGGGRIINVCSQLGYIGRADYTAYSMAKGGVIAFTRALARELAPHNILVNGVSPGLVDTGFDPLPEQAKAEHAASLPLQRLGQPRDMTSAFLFLAGATGDYYCGQILHPNGGEIMP